MLHALEGANRVERAKPQWVVAQEAVKGYAYGDVIGGWLKRPDDIAVRFGRATPQQRVATQYFEVARQALSGECIRTKPEHGRRVQHAESVPSPGGVLFEGRCRTWGDEQ
ncbi:hypothetical protein D3C76_1363040 [compost metagenome]